MKKTKYFNYEFYKIEEKLNILILGLTFFVLGFLLGFWCKNKTQEQKIDRQNIELDSLREKIHMERKE